MCLFDYTFYAQKVFFGCGSIKNLNKAVTEFGWERIMLCTTKGARSRGYVDLLEESLGNHLIVSYDRAEPHVPDYQVNETVNLATNYNIDAIIGLGGGSSIGLAKATSLGIEEKNNSGFARASFPTDQPLIPTIAIPTTYAGSEMTAVYGVTCHTDGSAQKVTVKDAKVTPKLTIYDPELTVGSPMNVTTGTGMNAIAHCIEALYSVSRNPVSTAVALNGIQIMTDALPRCCTNENDLDARTNMLTGSFLAGIALSNVTMGLHHGICHILGGSAGVSHGDANRIMLPHVIRFNIDETEAELAPAATVMGLANTGAHIKTAAKNVYLKIRNMVDEINSPYRLRDVGVEKEELPRLAELAFASRTVHKNPKRITNVGQLEELLQEAW